MQSPSFRKWFVGASSVAALGFASLTALQAQTILYSTTFDSAQGYSSGTTLSGQPTNGGTGSWDTNDPDNGATTLAAGAGKSIGQSDLVTTYVPTTPTDYWGSLGGSQHGTTAASGVLPGQSTVYVFRQFGAPGVVPYLNFDVDMAIAQSTAANGSASNDKFAWTFQSGGVNLFSARFVPTTVDPVTGQLKFALRYTVGATGTEQTTTNGILSSSTYHLKIAVNVPNNTFSILLVPSNGDPTYQTGNIALTGIDSKTIDSIAATWILTDTTTANGGYMNAGSNALFFNNYVITVPEPSTWAMAGFGLMGLAVVAYRRSVRA